MFGGYAIFISLLLPFLVNPKTWDGQVFSVLHHDRIFSSFPGFYSVSSNTKHAESIIQTEFVPKFHTPPTLSLPQHITHTCDSDSSYGRCKIQIEHSRFLTSKERGLLFPTIALQDLQCFQLGQWGYEMLKLRTIEKYGEEAPPEALCRGAKSYDLFFPKHRKPDVEAPNLPLKELDSSVQPIDLSGLPGGYEFPSEDTPKKTLERQRDSYVRRAKYDVCIFDQQSFQLFHSHEGTLYVSVEPFQKSALHKTDSRPIVNPPDRQLRTGKLPEGFKGKFTAFRLKDVGFLLTPDGRLASVVPNGNEGLTITPIWTDETRPIVGVVQDASKSIYYAFGYDGKGSASKERFYFPLARKVEAMKYTRQAPYRKDEYDGHLESYACMLAVHEKMAPKAEEK